MRQLGIASLAAGWAITSSSKDPSCQLTRGSGSPSRCCAEVQLALSLPVGVYSWKSALPPLRSRLFRGLSARCSLVPASAMLTRHSRAVKLLFVSASRLGCSPHRAPQHEGSIIGEFVMSLLYRSSVACQSKDSRSAYLPSGDSCRDDIMLLTARHSYCETLLMYSCIALGMVCLVIPQLKIDWCIHPTCFTSK